MLAMFFHAISITQPGPEHLLAAERVLAYLFTTRHEYTTYGIGGEIGYHGTARTPHT